MPCLDFFCLVLELDAALPASLSRVPVASASAAGGCCSLSEVAQVAVLSAFAWSGVDPGTIFAGEGCTSAEVAGNGYAYSFAFFFFLPSSSLTFFKTPIR